MNKEHICVRCASTNTTFCEDNGYWLNECRDCGQTWCEEESVPAFLNKLRGNAIIMQFGETLVNDKTAIFAIIDNNTFGTERCIIYKNELINGRKSVEFPFNRDLRIMTIGLDTVYYSILVNGQTTVVIAPFIDRLYSNSP